MRLEADKGFDLAINDMCMSTHARVNEMTKNPEDLVPRAAERSDSRGHGTRWRRSGR